MLHSFNVTIIFVVFTAIQQVLNRSCEFNIFAKTESGAGDKLFGNKSGVKNSVSDYLCFPFDN